MTAFVYKWTNIENGEYYIGVHRGSIDDGYIGSGTLFIRKFKKHSDLFERKILKFFDTLEQALEYEKMIVTEETLQDEKCLNLKVGGEGGAIPNFNKIYNIDFKARAASRKEKAIKNNISYTQHRVGYKFSTDSKSVMSDKAKNRQKIECPHCSKIGPIPQMKQWHFQNCKEKIQCF